MINKNFNTTIDYEMIDGSKVKLTLTFYALYQMKSKKPFLYKKYNEIMNKTSKGNYDELDMVTILYTAYVCANLENENILSEEDFMYLLGSDRKALGNAVQKLTSPKKQQGFDKHSNKGHIQQNQK